MNRTFGLVAKACGLFVSVLAIGCSASTPAAPRVAAHDAGARCAGRNVTSDAELTALAGCREVQGNLRITGVSSLEPLAGLQHVKGELTVSDTSELDDVSGLEELESCEDLLITRNSDLDDLSALRSLRSVRRVNISGNQELENLQGLGGLRRVDTLVLERNGFYNLAGLEGIEQIGRMWVASNPRLISMGSLNQTRSAGEVVIKNNPRLSAYYGLLRGLERMPERAVVEGNRGITPAETALLWQSGTRQVAAR